jgi:GGDEF domain-containing protein
MFYIPVVPSKRKEIFEIHAMRDSLTGLYNRYYFEERIKEEIKR